MRELLDAPNPLPLLIEAEDGLDTEEIGRYLHARAARPGAFHAIDCTAPDAEHRLFGADVGAVGRLEVVGRRSPLVAVPAGTVFLRHLGDLPASAQRRLARVLRDGEALVAGRRRARLIARVIACAVPGVDVEVRDGRIRPDLLRRFGPTRPQIPALRARPEDVAEIVQRAAADTAAAADRPLATLTRAAVTVLAALPWPGNLRELRAVLQRVIGNAEHDSIRQEDVLTELAMNVRSVRVSADVTLREARRRFERQYIAAVLEQHGWRMSEAARTLGIERANLYRKTRHLGITRRAPGRMADAS